MTFSIKWSEEAEKEFEEIYDYWHSITDSVIYSQKLFNLIIQNTNLISNNPALGIKTDMDNIRMRLINQKYYLIYKIEANHIQILKILDTRTDPKKNIFKKKLD